MVKITASVAVGISLGAIVAAGPVQAYSVQSFFGNNETISENAQFGGLLLAFSTEAYRSQQAGNASRAACIAQMLIPKGKEGGPGFDLMMDHMRDSKNKAGESVESYVLGAMNSFCPEQGGGQILITSPPQQFEPTSVKTFFDRFKSGQDKFDALSLAISTQALRVMNAGDEARGKCILDNLSMKRNGKEVILPLGIQSLAKELNQLRESNTNNVEHHILSNIDGQCGKEKINNGSLQDSQGQSQKK
jgi:hypothetical protein